MFFQAAVSFISSSLQWRPLLGIVDADEPFATSIALLVEDGPDNQRLISFQLRKAGAEVEIADNGRIAAEHVTEDQTLHGALKSPFPFDLIVTDIQMPEMDGYSATRLLRSKGCKVPILALTAHAMSGDMEKCLAAGCNAHLGKPIEKTKLLNECARWTANVVKPSVEQSKATAPVTAAVTPLPVSGGLRSEFEDDEMMLPLIREFQKTLSSTSNLCLNLLEHGKFVELNVLAHQLKGSAGGHGYPTITTAAQRLESSLRGGSDIEEIRIATEELSRLCSAATRTSPAQPRTTQAI